MRILSVVAIVVGVAGCAGKATVSSEPHQRDPRLASQHVQLGLTLMDQKRYDQAEKEFQQALALDAYSGVAHNDLGKVYYHQGKLYLAAWEFQYAAGLLPFHAEPRNNLGMVLEAAGKLNEAVASYSTALHLQPDNPQIMGNLLRARVRRGDPPDVMREELTEYVMKETRPDWLRWARQQLSRASSAAPPPVTRPERS